jgi:hypothetical protein
MSFQQQLDKFGNKKDLTALGTSYLRQMSGKWTTNGRSLANFPFNYESRQTGTSGLITASGTGFSLAAGYRYRVTAIVQVYQAGSSWTGYQLKFNGTKVDNMYMGHGFNGAVSSNNRMYSCFADVDATTTTTVLVVNGDGDSGGNWIFENTSRLFAEVIGVL